MRKCGVPFAIPSPYATHVLLLCERLTVLGTNEKRFLMINCFRVKTGTCKHLYEPSPTFYFSRLLFSHATRKSGLMHLPLSSLPPTTEPTDLTRSASSPALYTKCILLVFFPGMLFSYPILPPMGIGASSQGLSLSPRESCLRKKWNRHSQFCNQSAGRSQGG